MSIQRIAVIGLGNIGSSLALAIRSNEAADVEVVAYARNVKTAPDAIRIGEVDLTELLAATDLVVLATPVAAMKQVMQQINPLLASAAVVTDVGSTKVDVNAWGRQYIGPDAVFIGGHPMAGSAATGIAGANGDMFKDTVFLRGARIRYTGTRLLSAGAAD